MYPLRAADGGVLVRNGHTEGAIDLVRIAGLQPGAMICEVMRDDGQMARRPELEVRPTELVSQAAIVAQGIHREDADPAHETAAHLGSREHRLAGAGLAQDDGVVARMGEAVEHDRRAARPGSAVQVPRRLVQV